MEKIVRDSEFYKGIGSKGGRATVERHGHQHMSEIGRRGYIVTTLKWFGGSEKAHREWLTEMGERVYWEMSSVPMKYYADGTPVWPSDRPVHPAHVSEPMPEEFVRSGLEMFKENPF